MPTINGPIIFGGKDNTGLEAMIKSGKVKLPFKASGWKSDKHSDLVQDDGRGGGKGKGKGKGVKDTKKTKAKVEGSVKTKVAKALKRKKTK